MTSRQRTAILVTAMAALGCGGGGGGGGNDAPYDGVTSGSRLKVQWNVLEGTRVPAGLFDEWNDAVCRYRRWNDGKAYCTPVASGVVFLDARCTTPAVEVVSATPPAYAQDTSGDSCDPAVIHLYGVGARRAAVPLFRRNSDGSCEAHRTGEIYEIGAEVARFDLVEMTEERSSGSRMVRRFHVSTDGARMYAGPYDTQLDIACGVSPHRDGVTVLAPSNAAFSSHYSDASCETPVVEKDASCPAPRYGSRSAGNKCSFGEDKFYRIGPEVAWPPNENANGQCIPETRDIDRRYYELGAEVSAFSKIRERRASGGNLIDYMVVFDGGTVLPDPLHLYDVVHDVECSLVSFVDGRTRCLETGTGVFDLFSDPVCATPIRLAIDSPVEDGCEVPAPPKFARDGASMFRVAERYLGPVFELDGVDCILNEPDIGFLYYRVGAETPINEFPEWALLTDP